MYVRRRAWWAANDTIRDNGDETISSTLSQKANLEAMAGLLYENDPEHCITMAEINRELKNYDRCIQILKEPFINERHNEVASVIKKFAEQKIWKVAKTNKD